MVIIIKKINNNIGITIPDIFYMNSKFLVWPALRNSYTGLNKIVHTSKLNFATSNKKKKKKITVPSCNLF